MQRIFSSLFFPYRVSTKHPVELLILLDVKYVTFGIMELLQLNQYNYLFALYLVEIVHVLRQNLLTICLFLLNLIVSDLLISSVGIFLDNVGSSLRGRVLAKEFCDFEGFFYMMTG